MRGKIVSQEEKRVEREVKKNTNAANVEKNPCHAPWDETGLINTECAKRVLLHLIPEQVS